MEVLAERWGAVTWNCQARLLPWVLMGPSGSGHLGRSPGGSSPAALEPGQGTLRPVQTQFRMSPQAALRSPSSRSVALAGCPRSLFSLTCFPHTLDGNLPKSGSSIGPVSPQGQGFLRYPFLFSLSAEHCSLRQDNTVVLSS